MFKKLISNFNAPTPAKMRRIGAALTAIGAIGLSVDFLSPFPLLHKAVIVSAMVGALITNFYKEK